MRNVQTGKWHYALLVGMGLVLMSTGSVAPGQQPQQPSQGPLNVYHIPPAAQEFPAESEPGEAETLHLLVGQSLVVNSPEPIKRLSAAQPGIIDAVEQNSNQVQISGKAPGAVSLVVWDEMGQSQEFNVYVDSADRSSMEQLPAAAPYAPRGAEVHTRRVAWFGWGVMASIMLLAGVFLRVRRQREPYLSGFDLQLPKVGSPDDSQEPVLAAPHNARAEEHPVEETFTGDMTGQAEDIERIIQEFGEPWSRPFQNQPTAPGARRKEELKALALAVEESRQQLASLADAKLASLLESAREEYGRRIAQALREQTQVMQEAAEEKARTVQQAVEAAIAQLETAGQNRETRVQQMAQAFQDQVQAMREAAVGEVQAVKQAAEEAIARLQAGEQARETNLQQMAQAFREQAQAMREAADGDLKSIKQTTAETMAQLQAAEQTRATSFQQMALALQEQTLVLRDGADGEAKSIKRAAEEAIAQLQAAEQERQTSFLARAAAADERLAGMSAGVEALQGRVGALTEDLQGKHTRQAEDLEKVGQQLGERLTQQFQEQAGAAERLREELKSLARAVEESKLQLASLAEANAASLMQVAANAAAEIETEHRRLKDQSRAPRIEFENASVKRVEKSPSASFERSNRPKKRGDVAQSVLVAALLLTIAASIFGFYLWTHPAMRLRADAPAEFIDQSSSWSPRRRVRESELAQAYWQVAVANLQRKYPFGSELPAEPPAEFQVDNKYAALDGAKSLSDSRARYWERLRKSWAQPQCWVESNEGSAWWADRFWQVWDQLHLSK